MDTLIVERKLDSLQRCLARLHAKAPADTAQLRGDIDLQDVLVLNLSRAVQLCVDMAAHLIAKHAWPPPNTMGETFDRLAEHGLLPADLALRMKKAVGSATSPSMPTTRSAGTSRSPSAPGTSRISKPSDA